MNFEHEHVSSHRSELQKCRSSFFSMHTGFDVKHMIAVNFSTQNLKRKTLAYGPVQCLWGNTQVTDVSYHNILHAFLYRSCGARSSSPQLHAMCIIILSYGQNPSYSYPLVPFHPIREVLLYSQWLSSSIINASNDPKLELPLYFYPDNIAKGWGKVGMTIPD